MSLSDELEPFLHLVDTEKTREFWAEAEALPETDETLDEILNRVERENIDYEREKEGLPPEMSTRPNRCQSRIARTAPNGPEAVVQCQRDPHLLGVHIAGELTWDNDSPDIITPVKTDSAPRTWRIPPEPGPEVQAIRAEAYPHYLLVRVDNADADGKTWWCIQHDDGSLGGRNDWDYLIRHEGTITDATHEV